MNDFDKIFSEKLHNHKTPPPANGWDQLNAALDKEQNTKKKVVYWRVAAAITLIFLTGIVWWGMHKDLQQVPVADESPMPVEEPNLLEQQMDEKPGQIALNDELAPTDLTKKQKNISEKSAESVVEHRSEEKKIEKKQEKQTQSALASAEIETTDTTTIQPIENVQTVEALALEPLTITKNELLALESVKSRVSTSVTIIYKPGTTSADQFEETEDKGLAMELLNDIKNSSISFSDIRNAKAELLAKVFSKKENEVTP